MIRRFLTGIAPDREDAVLLAVAFLTFILFARALPWLLWEMLHG